MALLALSTLLLMLIFSAVEVDGEVDAEALTCPDQQQAFEGSCFEFVSMQRSFFSAQGWCERGGGHLAFIQNDETQQFLQKHLQPQLDWWLGLAPASFNLSLDSAATEGPLSWLDGSDVSYSNWFGEPVPGAGCGYISKDSGFQWGTTTNCSQEFFFICEFESGRSLACADHNATLQCGSGQVIEIDDSFYGRRTLHYCRNSRSPSQAPAQKECSWMDVVDLVSEHCHGLQVCQATADVASFGEPCPGLGSYLSVEYHCKNGLHLLMDKLAAVFENVTLTVKWLLHPFQGNLTCTLGTGDGHTIDPYSPEGAQGTVVHQYQHAGIYTVTVECSTSEWHVTAQKTITIQEPVGEFRTIRCHSSNHWTDGENCKGLYQHDLIIQVELESGTNVSYKIQHNGTEISRSSAVRGTVPHNITLPPETLQHLGAGCHQLTLLTSNRAAAVDVWTALELCVVEPVEGLLASLASDQDFCSGSFLYINVSVRSGAPVELLFMISAANENVSETHQTLNSNHQVFNISSTSKGTLNVLVRAWNLFSVMEVDAGNVTAECQSLSETGQDEHSTGEMVRLPRDSNPEITVDPENPVIGTNSVTLGVKNLQGNNKQYTFAWSCSQDCPCAVTAITETFVINAACLPAPYSFSVYSLTATRLTGNPKPETATKCITVTPRTDFRPVITCSNCSPVNVRMDVNLQLQCSGCQQIVWYFEDTSSVSEIIKSCYSNINQKPLIKMGENVSSLTVPSSTLINAVQNIVVLVYGVNGAYSGSTKFTIPIFSTTTTTTSTSQPTTQTPTTTTQPNSATTPSTTTSQLTRGTPTTTTRTTSATTPSTTTSQLTTGTPTTTRQSTTATTISPTTSQLTTQAPTTTTQATSATTPSITTSTTQSIARPTTSTTTTSPTSTTSTTVPTRFTTTSPPSPPSCTISPTVGDILSPFNITCTVQPSFCWSAPCTYCFRTSSGHYLHCGHEWAVHSLFLPLGAGSNHSVVVLITVQNGAGQRINTSVSVQVNQVSSGSTVQDLEALVSKEVNLKGAALAQMYQSVCSRLNGSSANGQEQTARKKLREKMLLNLDTAVNTAPITNPSEMQMVAGAMVSLTAQSDELSPTAQLNASSLLSDLSQSLVSLAQSEESAKDVMVQAATPLLQAASNILKASASTENQEKTSKLLLNAADSIQSAMLAGKPANQEPIIISTAQISMYVNRMSPDKLQKQSFSIENSSSASFTLPSLGSGVLPLEEPVDVRMLSFGMNPFSWSKSDDISGSVGGLSLTTENGSAIPVTGLNEEIEILLPRAVVGEVNSTFLDLGNYSTLIINVTTPDISLVLKLDPSEETPLQLLLGFEEYPNDTNYTAKIQLPHPGVSTEDRYTWVLDSRDLTVEVGVYFLLVRPVVEAGVNSSNTSVFITSIAAQCKYWDETKTNWSDYGCRVGPRTTPQLTQCLCTHLTFFGSSFFVMPNLVDVSRTAELFATFVNNPVVVCFVGAIFLAYLLVVIWARRKDIQDTAKLKLTVLEDNDPLAEYRYLVTVTTGHRLGASTSSQVTVTILGSEGESEPHHLTDPDKPVFERGAVDMFLLTTPFSLGDLQSIRLWHDNSGTHPAWFVNKVMVQDLETGQKWHFLCSSWLAIDVGECTLDKVFPVATEMDLKQFSNLFFMKTAKDFRDGHIWFSVISRPPSSNFTRVQRVSCCFSLLLCTMLTNIMFWGIPTDPSEQTMDLGKIEFTWQQVMIGIQSSIIMFPINLLIVSIFRNTRPRERKPENAPKPQPKIDSTKQGKTGRVSPTDPPSPQTERQITPDTVIKDIKKIAQSLSKVLRSPMPRMDCGNMDINALLSLVEDIIRQQNRAGGEFYSDDCKKELSLSLRAVNLQEGSPERTSNEKRHLYRQYLYKQLQNVEKELKLLGPSRFSKPDGYSRAVLQVQSMKGLLEPNPFSSSSGDWYSGSSSPVEGGDSGDKKKKKCCQKGLPWWFVFVGWFLVAATSGVSAYFTMMYGLTYGKQKSISWLISMLVSFFESLFITQPVKVLGFAVFFALVLKKVDQEEYGDVPIDGNLPNSDDPDAVRFARRDSTCSFYQPPPPSNIEKMRNNMIKEQKVFGLIREILIYMGFLWMLLLVAYGQRDPNAFYLTQHIQQSFSNGISDSMTHGEVFQWANSTLLNNLFGQQPGFITDGNSKLVGNARLRQVRVQDGSCRVDRSMRNSVPDCHAPYSWDMEDLGSYGPGWNPSIDANLSKTLPTPWQYQTQSRLRAHPIWGGVAVYRGGGFVVDLGPNRENASSSLQYLFENTWLDMFTRAIFVEFTVYNANVNLFCIVTLMFETTAVGAFQYRSELQSVRLYQSTGGLHIFVMASEVVYFLFIFYYMFQQGKLMKQQKWEYFRSKWNLLDMAIIILSWSALPVFIKRTLLGNQSIEYYQNHKDEYAGFNETATADAVLGYIIAFLVLLATVKLWHLLRLNPKLHMITSTLQRAWNDISGFIVVMTIMFLAYSVACNLLYGWKLYSYRTLLNAAQTIVSLQLGIFNYEEVLDYNPVLGAFIVGSCIIFMTFVVLNLFISVILVAFSEEQIHHKPSEEEEIVDLMLMKICSLFGVKVKNQQQNDATIANTGPSVIS
ncbi:polycystic kidney disease protein 1-like 2 [Astyanax mexicanus]|uniref:polycystic kidney disease protein 1-like 2 n=1 Tax=Astyanax mexicanus TaxID=7994 RepID=UPI0020CB1B5C|nr:polycystic kidney disease protein 1-like 2 [Astyanax mexicanus]